MCICVDKYDTKLSGLITILSDCLSEHLSEGIIRRIMPSDKCKLK